MQVAERIVGDEGTEVVISVARPIGTSFTASFTTSFTASFTTSLWVTRARKSSDP
jgi:hypothetical protein